MLALAPSIVLRFFRPLPSISDEPTTGMSRPCNRRARQQWFSDLLLYFCFICTVRFHCRQISSFDQSFIITHINLLPSVTCSFYRAHQICLAAFDLLLCNAPRAAGHAAHVTSPRLLVSTSIHRRNVHSHSFGIKAFFFSNNGQKFQTNSKTN